MNERRPSFFENLGNAPRDAFKMLKRKKEKKGEDNEVTEPAVEKPDNVVDLPPGDAVTEGYEIEEGPSEDAIEGWKDQIAMHEQMIKTRDRALEKNRLDKESLRAIGESGDNPDFFKANLLRAYSDPTLKENLQRRYRKENIDQKVKDAITWAMDRYVGPDKQFKSLESLVSWIDGESTRVHGVLEKQDKFLVENSEAIDKQNIERLKAESSFYDAKSKNLDLLENGDEIEFSVSKGAPKILYRVEKSGKGTPKLRAVDRGDNGGPEIILLSNIDEDSGTKKMIQEALKKAADKKRVEAHFAGIQATRNKAERLAS